jgi:hypothetical protein
MESGAFLFIFIGKTQANVILSGAKNLSDVG